MPERCGEKIRYETKKLAKAAMRRVQGYHEGECVRRVYRCPDWHLTTEPKPVARTEPQVSGGSELAAAYRTLRAGGSSHAAAIDSLAARYELDRGTLRGTLKRAGAIRERTVQLLPAGESASGT